MSTSKEHNRDNLLQSLTFDMYKYIPVAQPTQTRETEESVVRTSVSSEQELNRQYWTREATDRSVLTREATHRSVLSDRSVLGEKQSLIEVRAQMMSRSVAAVISNKEQSPRNLRR